MQIRQTQHFGSNVILFNNVTVLVAADDPSLLREATVPIVSNTQCRSWYGAYYTIYDVHVCAG